MVELAAQAYLSNCLMREINREVGIEEIYRDREDRDVVECLELMNGNRLGVTSI